MNMKFGTKASNNISGKHENEALTSMVLVIKLKKIDELQEVPCTEPRFGCGLSSIFC